MTALEVFFIGLLVARHADHRMVRVLRRVPALQGPALTVAVDGRPRAARRSATVLIRLSPSRGGPPCRSRCPTVSRPRSTRSPGSSAAGAARVSSRTPASTESAVHPGGRRRPTTAARTSRTRTTIRLVVAPDDPAALVADGRRGRPSTAAEPGPVWSTESGYWRVPPERPEGVARPTSTPSSCCSPTRPGHVTLYVGAVGNGRIDLASDLVARTATGAAEVTRGDPAVRPRRGRPHVGQGHRRVRPPAAVVRVGAPDPRGRADHGPSRPARRAPDVTEPARRGTAARCSPGTVPSRAPGPTPASPGTTATRRPSSARSPRGGAVVDQSHLGVVTVTGPDRLTWLHSLTSQDARRPAAAHVDRAARARPARARRARRRASSTTATTHVAAHRGRAGRRSPPGSTACASCCASRSPTSPTSGRRSASPSTPRAAADEPVTWRDPWPRTRARRHAVRPGRRRAPRRRPRVAARAGAARRPGRRRRAPARPPGWRLAGTWAAEALRVAAWRPRARARGRPPDDPARARLAAHRRAPAQGLLPRPGDGGARAQPRPAAAPARHAAPRRLRAPAARAGCGASRLDGDAAGRRRSPASRGTTSSGRSRSPSSSGACRRTRRCSSTATAATSPPARRSSCRARASRPTARPRAAR